MEPILTSIIAAVVAGAVAKAKDVASNLISDAYEGLKGLIVRKLGGKSGAVQSVEEDTESDSAQEALAESLSKHGLASDGELKALAERVEAAIAEAKASGAAGAGDIEIGIIRGRVNVTVKNLVAAGRISIDSIVAETGDVTVDGLWAGPGNPAAGAAEKNG